ncbi:vWA domain-containing protein [Crassaminicella indica]|uniref:VWA domain-containing protein n=1 Tax=Crassaminicella indica TaxID=2855394 RepID=A0ABX8RC23_9CLOT|nr:vWA domain-containing protein [Crassaminicella indica]QXM06002.1 VWA domain-containing protein [Crassaminicella indica]
MIKSKSYQNKIAFILICFMLFYNQINFLSYAEGSNINVKAPINLVRQSDHDKIKRGETFTINYKLQPQPIPAEDILPESYLKNKEIVLVMDTSGSMKEYIDFNYNDTQISLQGIHAVKNINIWKRWYTSGCYLNHYRMSFKKPPAGENQHTKYFIFYSTDEINTIENWIKNLNTNQLYKYIQKNRAFMINKDHSKNYIKFPINLKDITGNYYNCYYNYHVYIATIDTSKSNPVIGLANEQSTAQPIHKEMKISVMKKVTKNFLEKFKNDSRVKVALIPYASYAKDIVFNNDNFVNLSSPTQYNNLINNINKLQAYGGTNIGDGLRKAYYKFSDSDNIRKYVILMTDGEPTFHSSTTKLIWNGWFYEPVEDQQYLGDGSYPNDYEYFGGGNHSTYRDKIYANKVAKDLLVNGKHKINSFMIAFSNDANGAELKNIANSANGYYKKAEDGNALDEVYEQLADIIQSDFPIHGIHYEETFPNGLKVVDVSEGLEIKGQKVIGDIGSISYKLNKETNTFEAEPFEFYVTLKANNIGDYKLVNNIMHYKDINGTDEQKKFPSLSIYVYEMEPPEIKAHLTDAESNINKYKLTIDINESSKIKIINDNHIIYTSNNYEDPKAFSIEINKADIVGNHIIIQATDQSGNITEETVPIISLLPFEMNDYFHTDNTRPVKVKLATENNSTIKEIKANGNIIAQERLTNQGKYEHMIILNDGNNLIKIFVQNSYGNTATLSFNREIDACSPELVGIYVDNDSKIKITSKEEILFTTLEVDINGDGIITDGSINEKGEPTLDEIFGPSEVTIVPLDGEYGFKVSMQDAWYGKEIIIKAKDTAGNIGAVNLKNNNKIIKHGIILLNNKNFEIIDKADNSIDIVNKQNTHIGILLNVSTPGSKIMNLSFNFKKAPNINIESPKCSLYQINDNKLESIQENIRISQSTTDSYHIPLSINTDSSKSYVLIYTLKPDIPEDQIGKGICIVNQAEIQGSTKNIKLCIKPRPIIE